MQGVLSRTSYGFDTGWELATSAYDPGPYTSKQSLRVRQCSSEVVSQGEVTNTYSYHWMLNAIQPLARVCYPNFTRALL